MSASWPPPAGLGLLSNGWTVIHVNGEEFDERFARSPQFVRTAFLRKRNAATVPKGQPVVIDGELSAWVPPTFERIQPPRFERLQK